MAVLLACGGADLVLPSDGEPAAVEITKGDGQSGRVGAALADSLVVRVADSQGRPVSGVPVAFAFTSDGSDATVAPDTATTGAGGLAAFQLVLGTRVGKASAEVRVTTAGGDRTLSAPVSFTAVSADANELRAVAGDSQAAPAGAALGQPLVVEVTDAFGNPIAGVTVAWEADAGGTVSQATTSTGDDGTATVERTLGPSAGVQHTSAIAPGLAGSPVVFTHTARAGAAAVLERVSGDGQRALVGSSVADPLVVRVHDDAGNAVSGLAVAWVRGAGGGTLTPETSMTDEDGMASTRWTLGRIAGENTVTAVVSGVGTVGFTANADPGTPPGLTLETQPPETAVRGVSLSRRPAVQIREPDGAARRQSGVSVRVSLSSGGGILRGTLTRATDGDGRAEFGDLALEGPAGSYTLAFVASGYAGATSSAIALARAPTTTTVLSDAPDPSPPGAAVRVRFRVTSPGGTPSGTVRVTSDDGASCEAGMAAGECSLSPSSAGARTLTAAYAGDAQFEGSAASEAHRVEAPEQPPAPAATATRITRDDPDPSDVGQVVTVRFTVTGAGGTPAGQVTVTASGGGETCTGSVADGACVLTLAAPGDRTLTATYAGAGGFAGSSGTERHQVRAPPPPPPPPPVPSATASSIEVKDQRIDVDKRTRVTVTVRDASGSPLERVAVTLSATGSGNRISPETATTGRGGEAHFDFQSSEPGSKTLTAVAGGVALEQQATVTVGPGGG